MMPVATPPNAIVFSSGWIDRRQMAQVGIGLNVLGILLVTAMSYATLYFILGIDPEVFPAWAASPASGHRTPAALLTDDQMCLLPLKALMSATASRRAPSRRAGYCTSTPAAKDGNEFMLSRTYREKALEIIITAFLSHCFSFLRSRPNSMVRNWPRTTGASERFVR